MLNRFRPACEGLEERLTPATGENIDLAIELTNAVKREYIAAATNINKLEEINTKVEDIAKEVESGRGLPSIGVLNEYLTDARTIVAFEHRVANSVRLLELSERVYQAEFRKFGVSFNATQFAAWDHDFHVDDNWIRLKAVPYIDAMEAFFERELRKAP